MEKEYNVFHKKDFSAQRLKENIAKREIYDSRKTFTDLNKAQEFAMSVLHEQPILMKYASVKTTKNEQIKNTDNPYMVAAYFIDKYHHYCGLDDSSNPVPTHEIERCNLEQLENVLMKLAEEKPNKLYWGIELKLIPSLEYFK